MQQPRAVPCFRTKNTVAKFSDGICTLLQRGCPVSHLMRGSGMSDM